MDVRTFRALEWDRVLALAALCASTEEGGRRVAELTPSTDRPEVLRRQARVRRYANLEAQQGPLSLEGYRRAPTRSPEGTFFDLETLRTLRTSLDRWKSALDWVQTDEDEDSPLKAILPPDDGAEAVRRRLQSLMDDRGEIADTASPRLNSLRRERNQVRIRLRGLMDAMASDLGDAVLQQQEYTIRGGRLVLPVKSSHKGAVPGILHDVSSTGATIFMEPMQAVEHNNRLSAIDSEEREEIRRILLQITSDITRISDRLEALFDAVEHLDAIRARARFGRIYGGILPAPPESEDTLDLRGATHPLLDPRLNGLRAQIWKQPPCDRAVPLDLTLSLGGTRTLVISGPNAGGKSVALKTAGLLCLMHQAGIPIPASSETSLPVLKFLFASLGDDQSIQDSLSTFSGRMLHIREAFQRLREPFLVILDELGSGTDPAEGAALGEALLLHFHRRRGFILCSTHHDPLKARALAADGMGNASMAFNEEDLSPTFQLTMGTVGASRALDIAARMGLPDRVLEEARALLPGEQKRLKDVLETLEAEVAAHEAELAGLKARHLEAANLRKKLEDRLAGMEQERRRIVESLPEQMRVWREEFISELKSEVNLQRVRRRARESAPKVLEEASQELGLPPVAEHPSGDVPPPGARVRLEGFGLEGEVEESDAATGRITVLCGDKKLQVGAADVTVLAPSPGPSLRNSAWSGAEVSSLSPELNLIGQTAAEAEFELEHYLDRVLRSGLREVRIIHGIGTGKLRSAVHQLLKRTPHVDSWEEAPPSQGGAGATIVRMASG
jgi:DNA mismatch repair protein MutS2